MKRQVIETADGSKTLFIPDMNEQYHSVNGARTESEYVFLKQGYLHHSSESVVVFEVGFGTGLNALLTALKAEEQKRPTKFISIEKYPIEVSEIQNLNYGKQISEKADVLFKKLHDAAWNETTKISDYFTLHKIQADLKLLSFDNYEHFDVIYFDAFAPDKQPQLWEPEIFERIYNACNEGAIFVTYSAKGVIRRQLATTGFVMERLPGPPGKRQMLRGTKLS
ncbi:tRNA (5-methylaminomethyl-2-thiouridine)(34)-methyltransferase MnmD [Maribellus sediminis]|uniref:tRNA (5-methylaminomethyl-2-thiouridine)(34)-methyltransferase MnmD n=1 Tax=Maribellus sediminis TaxID=2696285 RepID=UPI00142F40BE|nr:tRNA (5-methylaminomethyl-2-thiouridine)(34)-methyltransferase MnmD [Maribellus sediminis]